MNTGITIKKIIDALNLADDFVTEASQLDANRIFAIKNGAEPSFEELSKISIAIKLPVEVIQILATEEDVNVSRFEFLKSIFPNLEMLSNAVRS